MESLSRFGFRILGVAATGALLAAVPGCKIVVSDTCGDGFRDVGEDCDDGNNRDGDGCSADCFFETFCGDGFLDSVEECDDGNNINGDGCSASCRIETVVPVCGDGFTDAGEECDDGNNADGDGCSFDCFLESTGYLECQIGGMCSGRDTCFEITIPSAGTHGGMCTHTCTVDGDCMMDHGFPGRCYSVEGAAAVCYQECAANSDCYTGTTCIDVTFPGMNDSICVPNNL
ncbi:MAG: DUF4215 domain-containing protein [Sandaracinaceae bacterium]